MTNSKEISNALCNIDHYMDVFGLGVNNLVNCVTKVCIGIYRRCVGEKKLHENRESSFLKNYWTYLDKKKGWECALGVIPIAGQLLIRIKKAFDKKDCVRFRYVTFNPDERELNSQKTVDSSQVSVNDTESVTTLTGISEEQPAGSSTPKELSQEEIDNELESRLIKQLRSEESVESSERLVFLPATKIPESIDSHHDLDIPDDIEVSDRDSLDCR